MVVSLNPCVVYFLLYHLCYLNLVVKTQFWNTTLQTITPDLQTLQAQQLQVLPYRLVQSIAYPKVAPKQMRP